MPRSATFSVLGELTASPSPKASLKAMRVLNSHTSVAVCGPLMSSTQLSELTASSGRTGDGFDRD